METLHGDCLIIIIDILHFVRDFCKHRRLHLAGMSTGLIGAGGFQWEAQGNTRHMRRYSSSICVGRGR